MLKVSLDPLDAENPVIKKELENLQLIKELTGHPRLVILYDSWLLDGYFVSRWEYTPEGNLEDRLGEFQGQGETGMPFELLWRYMQEAAEGIEFLHSRGIVHGGIKPTNLLLFLDRVKVAAMGLAKLVAGSTASHTGAGTLGYLPPEAYQGKITPSADLYALAATYLKLRNGREPFGTTPRQILDRQRAGKPMLGGLSKAEKSLVLAALQPEPRKRFKEGVLVWVRELGEASKKLTGKAKRCAPRTPRVGKSFRANTTSEESLRIIRLDPTLSHEEYRTVRCVGFSPEGEMVVTGALRTNSAVGSGSRPGNSANPTAEKTRLLVATHSQVFSL